MISVKKLLSIFIISLRKYLIFIFYIFIWNHLFISQLYSLNIIYMGKTNLFNILNYLVIWGINIFCFKDIFQFALRTCFMAFTIT